MSQKENSLPDFTTVSLILEQVIFMFFNLLLSLDFIGVEKLYNSVSSVWFDSIWFVELGLSKDVLVALYSLLILALLCVELFWSLNHLNPQKGSRYCNNNN